MSIEKGITPHETFDLYELLTMRNTCATKFLAMSKLVEDEELRSILQKDLVSSKEHIKELQDLIQVSVLASSGSFKTYKPVQTSRFASSSALDEVKVNEVPINVCLSNQSGDSKGVVQ